MPIVPISNGEWESIYEDLRPTVLGYLQGTLHQSPQESEDIFHDAVIRFRASYRRGFKPLNFMVQIVKNIVRDRARHSTRADNNLPNIPIPPNTNAEEDLLIHERLSQLRERILSGLRGREHTIACLWLSGESVHAISLTTGMQSRTVYRVLHKARRIVLNPHQ